MPERLYAMTHLGDGDWLCPSNDLRWLYRFLRYDEDGSAYSIVTNADGSETEDHIVGSFWLVQRTPMPSSNLKLSKIDFLPWDERAHMLRYRREAIDVMMREAEAA
jgi:hypothetical protein